VPLVRWLLDACSRPPCGADVCPAWLAATYHFANLAITVCYLAIPGIVLYYWRYRRDGIDPLHLWMVIAFLPAQALSRLSRIDGVPFPVIAVLDVLAAAVTVNSVAWLRPKILHILKLPSRQELHDLNDRLHTQVLHDRGAAHGGAAEERPASWPRSSCSAGPPAPAGSRKNTRPWTGSRRSSTRRQ
jgi:hypothetical protein